MIKFVLYLFFFLVLLNVNYVDGIDIFWIWDVNFEIIFMMNILEIFVGGVCYFEIVCCLCVIGYDEKCIK